MQKAGTILIYCYSMFGLRQRDCLVSDGKGGLLKIDTDYACGYEPPHYPVPAIPIEVTWTAHSLTVRPLIGPDVRRILIDRYRRSN
jgi:hypothetical protein